MFTALVIGGLVAGGFKAWGNAKSRNAAYDDKVQDLNRSKVTLDQNYAQTQESFALAKKQNAEATASANAELNLLGDQTLANRDMAIGQTATAGSMDSKVNALQVATLGVQAEEAVGAQNQKAALSGFRGSESNQALVDNTQRRGDEAMAEAKMKVSLSNNQTFSSAVNTYTSANQQKEAYARKVIANNEAKAREDANIDLQDAHTDASYLTQKGNLDADISYMANEGKRAKDWANWTGAAGDIINGGLSGYNAAGGYTGYEASKAAKAAKK